MKKENYFFIILVCCTLLFLSCKIINHVDEILLINTEEFTAEREFIEELFSQQDFQNNLRIHLIKKNDAQLNSPSLLINFTASWTQAEGEPVSKTWFVPKENPLNERTNTTLTDCFNGTETLVPIKEITPPYTGLLVDGLCVTDENYPLVRYITINVKAADDNVKNKRLQKKIAALETALKTTLAKMPSPLIQPQPKIVWICAAGDLMLDRGSGDILIEEGAVGILGGTSDYFIKSDISIVNLEGAVSDRGAKIKKSYNFRFNPKTVPALKAGNINAVLLANNHIYDYGETAFLDTLDYLEQNDIAILGAGRNITTAAAPFVYKTDQLEVRVFGMASFPIERSGWDGASVSATEKKAGMLFNGQDSVKKLKENFVKDDNVLNVLLFHGGHEWTWRPEAGTRSLYTDLAHSGADLLIGSHPHTVQGFEWIDDKLIFWSLGNYVFAGMKGIEGGEEGLMIRLGYVGKTLVYFEPVPVQLDGKRSDIGSARQLKRFYSLSRELAVK